MSLFFEKLQNYTLILASQSPRRQAFLKDMNLPFQVRILPVNESFPSHFSGYEITNYIAEKKAEALKHTLNKNEILITSDTLVYSENQILGKPKDEKEASKMLKQLSGKTHKVITSVCFTTLNYQKTIHETTEVTFKKLENWEIEYYIKNFKPYDKAGSYAIQEWIGFVGITSIKGNYNTVVGLPTHRIFEEISLIINAT